MARKYTRTAPYVARSIIGKTIEALQPGDSATFTRSANLQDEAEPSRLSHMIGSYVVRKHPSVPFTYETFEAITARRRYIVGVIVTREG